MSDKKQIPGLPVATEAKDNDRLIKRDMDSGSDEGLAVSVLLERSSEQVDAHTAETGGIHGVPAGERALHTGDAMIDFVMESTNLVRNPTFDEGYAGWAVFPGVSPQIIHSTNADGHGGKALPAFSVSLFDTTGRAGPTSNMRFPIDSTQDHVFTVRATPLGSGDDLAQVIVYAVDDQYDRTLIREIDHDFGLSPTHEGLVPSTDFPAGTVGVQVGVWRRGEAGSDERRLTVEYLSFTEERKFLAAFGTSTDGQTGSHEAQAVGDHLFILAHGYRRVSKFDSNLNRLGQTAELTLRPHDITYDGTSLWVITQGGASVHQINPDTLAVENTYGIDSGSQGFGIVYVPGENVLVLGVGNDATGDRLLTMDPETGSQVLLSTDVSIDRGSNLPVVYEAGSVWSIDGEAGILKRISLATGDTEESINVPNMPLAYGLGAGGGYVLMCGTNKMAQISATDNTLIRVVGFGSNPYQGSQNVFVDRGLAFANGLILDLETGAYSNWHNRISKWDHRVGNKYVSGPISRPWLNFHQVSDR